MTNKDRKVLVAGPSGSVGEVGGGTGGVLTRMVSDALVLAQSRNVVSRRIRIGAYELCEPDYRQVMLWAQALHLEPEIIIERLEESANQLSTGGWLSSWGEEGFVDTAFKLENGSIAALAWNFDLLPLARFEWTGNSTVRDLAFFGNRGPTEIFLSLHSLSRLQCSALKSLDQLGQLQASAVKLQKLTLNTCLSLTRLDCSGSGLVELDLSHVPALTSLNCSSNQLTELDLSHVPALTSLNCSSNRFTELDLSHVPALTSLNCSSNQFTEIDLSCVQALESLFCGINKLTELDLSFVPSLTMLVCPYNQLAELDLSGVPALRMLWCSENRIVELDLRSLPENMKPTCDSFVTIMQRADQGD